MGTPAFNLMVDLQRRIILYFADDDELHCQLVLSEDAIISY